MVGATEKGSRAERREGVLQARTALQREVGGKAGLPEEGHSGRAQRWSVWSRNWAGKVLRPRAWGSRTWRFL